MKILVTGFKPFLGEKLNPSELLAVQLAKKNSQVESLVLPVEFGQSFEVLKKHLLVNTYDYVIMLGQASGRDKICLEKIALNWVETEHEDESGQCPASGPISRRSPLALMSLFPVDSVYATLKEQGHSVAISFSAGTYVCNDLYFRMCEEFSSLKAVFVHVPLIRGQILAEDVRPFMELEVQESVLTAMVNALPSVQ